jgi:hypothetical protein
MILEINKKKLKIKACRSFLSKIIGLMFSRMNDIDGALLYFDKKDFYGIHMFFVFHPLDIFWLNEKKEVVDFQRAMPFAFKVYYPKKAAKYILELRSKSVDIKIGEKINFNS